jgi:hypothetical protein
MELTPEEADEFSVALEADLEQQYPGSSITVIPGNATDGTEAIVFQVVFLVDETDAALPSQVDLEQVIVERSYAGTLITTEDDTDNDDDSMTGNDETTGAPRSTLLLVLLVGVVLLLFSSCIILQRFRTRQRRQKSGSGDTAVYAVPL